MTKVTICFFLCAFTLKVTAQQNSYIQVKAEPNIGVFLNDEFKGKTNVEYSGLIIEKLKAGSYRIKVVKDGYTPQTETILLNPGEVKIYQVKPFVPQYKISQSGNKQQQTIELKTGSLKIQSLPVEIQIEITDLGIKSSKSQDEWNIEDIPIGIHKVKFTWNNKILNDTVRIEQGTFKHIFADLINGKVEIRSNSISSSHNNVSSAPITTETFSDKGISYSLQGRGFQALPPPKYDYQGEGRVVVEVSVDRAGKVVQATPGTKGSTTLDEYLLRVAKEAALGARFKVKQDAPAIQKGTITYNFKLK